MKVLVAGATGAIGKPLSRGLKAAGHDVIGTTRTPEGAARLAAGGVQPVVADAMDRDALLKALEGLRADAVIHELTSLRKPPARHSGMTQTNRLRTVGTENLLAAAQQLGASRFVTQSIVFGYGYADHREQILGEAAPFGRTDNRKTDPHLRAMQVNEHLVRQTAGIEGIALRYGIFYGGDRAMTDLLKARKLPIPATVSHPLPWIHIDDAAAATVAALERRAGGGGVQHRRRRHGVVGADVHRHGGGNWGPPPPCPAQLGHPDGGTLRRLDDPRHLDAGVQRPGQVGPRLGSAVPHSRRRTRGDRRRTGRLVDVADMEKS